MSDTLRQRFTAFVAAANPEQLAKLDDYAQLLALAAKQMPLSTTSGISRQDWPHAPVHRLSDHGTYIVTGRTLQKVKASHQTRLTATLGGAFFDRALRPPSRIIFTRSRLNGQMCHLHRGWFERTARPVQEQTIYGLKKCNAGD